MGVIKGLHPSFNENRPMMFVFQVLVDVPCNTDRHVLSDPDNNLFNKHRLPERLAMQNLQTKLLV